MNIFYKMNQDGIELLLLTPSSGYTRLRLASYPEFSDNLILPNGKSTCNDRHMSHVISCNPSTREPPQISLVGGVANMSQVDSTCHVPDASPIRQLVPGPHLSNLGRSDVCILTGKEGSIVLWNRYKWFEDE